MGNFSAALKLASLAGALILSCPAMAKAPPGASRTAPWNSETSDLEADSRIIYGILPNGLRYAIRRNDRPQNQVLIRMALDFGAAAEAEDEQGLAHFIEHMAFNGSTNVREGEMVRMLERLGLSFGADTNASTGYTRTQYRLDLPKADPDLIRQSLFLMRETASEVTFDPKAVDRERGVVIAEMRDRENVGFQRNRAANNLLYPNSYFSTRYPIGKLDVLQNASAEKMKALYRRWYVPDRARLVIVGPVDPVAIEQELVRQFSSWQGTGKALGEIDRCSFDNNRQAGADIFVHPETGEGLNIEQIVADKPRPDSFDRALLDVRMRIAGAILSDRISRKRRQEDIPLLGTGLSFAAGFCDQHARIGMAISGKDGSWKDVLPISEQIVRQAATYGFSDQEIAEQLRRFDAAFANAVASEVTTSSSVFAAELTNLDEDIVTGAEYRLRLWKQLRPFMTASLVSQEFAHWYGKLDRPQIFLSTRNADGAKPEDLLDAFAQSRKVAVAAPQTRADMQWAYTDFGPAGRVVEDKRIADLDIRTVRFANGVLLNLKRTDFEKDRIRWSLRIDGGRLAFAPEQQPLAMLMDGAYVSGGLGKYDIDDLRSVLSGSTASPAFSTGTDFFGGQGAVVPKDLERQFQLLAALASDPGYRQDAVRLFKRPLPEFYRRLDSTPGSALAIGQARILSGNDPRFVLPSLEAINAAEFSALQTALGESLLTGQLEIGLVGDLDEAAAIDSVARTFGALPKRASTPTDRTAAKSARFADAYGVHTLYHRGEPDQLTWRRIWPTTDDSDFRLEQTMSLLADIIQIRLLDELRENLGISYGSTTASDMSDVYPGRGTFAISTNGNPTDLEIIERTVDAVIAEIVEKPVAADLFERGRKPTLERFADWRKRNGTWIGIVDRAETQPVRLQRFRDNERQFQSITAEDIWRAAKTFLQKEKSYTFRVLPQPVTAGGN
jgi:zinc protease